MFKKMLLLTLLSMAVIGSFSVIDQADARVMVKFCNKK